MQNIYAALKNLKRMTLNSQKFRKTINFTRRFTGN